MARKNHVYRALIALLHGWHLHNSAVFINSDGTVQGSFDCCSPVGARVYFRAGHEFPVFDTTEFGKVALWCATADSPEAASHAGS